MSCYLVFDQIGPAQLNFVALRDALPISARVREQPACGIRGPLSALRLWYHAGAPTMGRECRSEEHTSELQSRENLVCRPLLEKKHCPNRSCAKLSSFSTASTASIATCSI